MRVALLSAAVIPLVLLEITVADASPVANVLTVNGRRVSMDGPTLNITHFTPSVSVTRQDHFQDADRDETETVAVNVPAGSPTDTTMYRINGKLYVNGEPADDNSVYRSGKSVSTESAEERAAEESPPSEAQTSGEDLSAMDVLPSNRRPEEDSTLPFSEEPVIRGELPLAETQAPHESTLGDPFSVLPPSIAAEVASLLASAQSAKPEPMTEQSPQPEREAPNPQPEQAEEQTPHSEPMAPQTPPPERFTSPTHMTSLGGPVVGALTSAVSPLTSALTTGLLTIPEALAHVSITSPVSSAPEVPGPEESKPRTPVINNRGGQVGISNLPDDGFIFAGPQGVVIRAPTGSSDNRVDSQNTDYVQIVIPPGGLPVITIPKRDETNQAAKPSGDIQSESSARPGRRPNRPNRRPNRPNRRPQHPNGTKPPVTPPSSASNKNPSLSEPSAAASELAPVVAPPAGAAPATDGPVAAETFPATDKPVAAEASPVTDELPTPKTSPATDGLPAAEASPVTDGPPVAEGSAATDEPLAAETAPATDQPLAADVSPAADKPPAPEASPATDGPSSVFVSPVTDGPTAAEASPGDELPAALESAVTNVLPTAGTSRAFNGLEVADSPLATIKPSAAAITSSWQNLFDQPFILGGSKLWELVNIKPADRFTGADRLTASTRAVRPLTGLALLYQPQPTSQLRYNSQR